MREAFALSAAPVLLLAAALWFVLLRPVPLGGDTGYILVRGTSMEPTYHNGDLVLTRRQAAYRTGEVVAYRVPDGEIGEGRVVIHRLVADGPAGFVAEGDNADAADPWTVPAGSIEGVAWLQLPAVGHVLLFLHDPARLAALAASAVITFLLLRHPAKARAPAARPPRASVRRLRRKEGRPVVSSSVPNQHE